MKNSTVKPPQNPKKELERRISGKLDKN